LKNGQVESLKQKEFSVDPRKFGMINPTGFKKFPIDKIK
jgi:hypothetical protein